MNVNFVTEELRKDVVDISSEELQSGLRELVKYISANGFDVLPEEWIEMLFKHDMIDVNDNIGVSCVLDGSDAFILGRVPEFDNRVCLICVDCYLSKQIHLGHSSGKLLVGMDSKHYKTIMKLKDK